MKSFIEVEKTRRDYHENSARNSVHRSSLLAPAIPGTSLDVSFLNHFLLKRGYKNVSCRVTEIDGSGGRIRSALIPINEPRSYTIGLTESAHGNATDFIVEFFSSDNLFIPFPAVMLNHRGSGFVNSVHAYNRVLNDVFEDDAINSISQREAAIDVCIDSDVSTFVVFAAGQDGCTGELKLRLSDGPNSYVATIPVSVKRFGHVELSLKEIFPEIESLNGGILTIEQPHQKMFYGRVLAGQRRADKSFSANHSYYDSSGTAEYWDNSKPSSRLYPYFHGFDNRIRFYPILSPGALNISVDIRTHSGRVLYLSDAWTLSIPGAEHLDFSITEIIRERNIAVEDVSAFSVIASPIAGNTPTRINHQLVLSSGGLETSINVSLANPNTFSPTGKKGFSWGQLTTGSEFESWLGVTTNSPDGPSCDVQISFYGTAGKITEKNYTLRSGSAEVFSIPDLLPQYRAGNIEYVWYELRSNRQDIFGYSLARNKRTDHCSGEHAF